jgi:hypothetical protein
MITDKVLGAYASLGGVPPAEQAEWYRQAGQSWGICTFELPLMAGAPLAAELAQVFAELQASLVVTLVAQWATAGQKHPAYGFASLDPAMRTIALLDAASVLQQCAALSQQGIRIRNLIVHTGRGTGETVRHAIALSRSLVKLRHMLAAVLPACVLTVEVTDCLPADHPIPFPAAKKAALKLPDLIETLAAVNADVPRENRIALMLNWGRLLINGDRPLDVLNTVLGSDVPLAGVILSGAGASPEGFRDSHNSHLDPASGFTAADAETCAAALRASSQPVFLGMKCSRAAATGELSGEQVLTAQAELLRQSMVYG